MLRFSFTIFFIKQLLFLFSQNSELNIINDIILLIFIRSIKSFFKNFNILNNRCLIRENGEWKYTNIEQLSNKLINKNSYELSKYYNNKKNNIEERIKDIDLIEFIYSRLNYLDLSINKNIYKDIKTEIKNIIKSTLLI